jgi:hypothetical protein
MIWINNAQYIDNFTLNITFNTGEEKMVNLENHLDGKIFEPLKKIEYFKKFQIDPELETITWENGADFAPEFLYEIAN